MSILLFPPAPPEDLREPIIDQGKYWRDVTGRYVAISDIDLAYVENVMSWLVKRAPAFAWAEVSRLEYCAHDAPDGVYWALMGEVGRIDSNPVKWLKRTKLYRALKKRRKAIRRAIKSQLIKEGRTQ